MSVLDDIMRAQDGAAVRQVAAQVGLSETETASALTGSAAGSVCATAAGALVSDGAASTTAASPLISKLPVMPIC